MNSFQLKVVAVLTMIIDHLGCFFFPQFGFLRIIGRLSFPLFSWFVANGVKYSHDAKKYLFRISAFALVSQVPFYLTNNIVSPNYFFLNAVFTLAIGLGAILLIRKTEHKYLWIFICFFAYCLAELLSTDYGGAGALSVISFYVYSKNMKMLAISQLFIYGYFVTYPALNDVMLHSVTQNNFVPLWEIFGLLSLFLIASYNRERGPKIKYLFYAFYPLHYFVIYLFLKIGV